MPKTDQKFTNPQKAKQIYTYSQLTLHDQSPKNGILKLLNNNNKKVKKWKAKPLKSVVMQWPIEGGWDLCLRMEKGGLYCTSDYVWLMIKLQEKVKMVALDRVEQSLRSN